MRAGYLIAVMLCMVNTLRMVWNRCIDLKYIYDGRVRLNPVYYIINHVPFITVSFLIQKITSRKNDNNPLDISDLMQGTARKTIYVPQRLYDGHFADFAEMVLSVNNEVFMREFGSDYVLSTTTGYTWFYQEILQESVEEIASKMGISSKKLDNCLCECEKLLYLKMYQKGYLPKGAFARLA